MLRVLRETGIHQMLATLPRLGSRVRIPSPAPKFINYIPGLRQNPKIIWADDAKIIGDGIAEALPVLGDFVAQEIERGVRKLSACGVAFVVRAFLRIHTCGFPDQAYQRSSVLEL